MVGGFRKTIYNIIKESGLFSIFFETLAAVTHQSNEADAHKQDGGGFGGMGD